MASLGLAGAVAACDTSAFRKDPATQPGEPLAVVDANVGPNRPMPVDGVVQIAFNRYLLPASVIRQSVRIVTASGQGTPSPRTTYDPVARTVTVFSPNPKGQPWLTEDQAYKIELGVPNAGEEFGGVRSLDGATLSAPVSISFIVGKATGQKDPDVAFCTDVLPIFFTKCAGDLCHGGSDRAKLPTMAAGLLLTTSAGIKATAISRAAQGAHTAGSGDPVRITADPTSGQSVFGVNMPLVDPENPGNSWLMYKILLAPPPKAPPVVPFALPICSNRGTPAGDYTPLVKVTEAPEEREQAVLRDAILGREMPYPTPAPRSYPELPLTFAEREKVRLWIAQGAAVPECGGCTPVDAPSAPVDGGVDGGPPDAGPSDAGPSDSGPADASGD